MPRHEYEDLLRPLTYPRVNGNHVGRTTQPSRLELPGELRDDVPPSRRSRAFECLCERRFHGVTLRGDGTLRIQSGIQRGLVQCSIGTRRRGASIRKCAMPQRCRVDTCASVAFESRPLR